MAIGENILKDRVIKKTTKIKNIKNKTRKANKRRIKNNTNITSIGMPSHNPGTDTYKTKKKTFYVKVELLDKLYNFSYWDRHTVTEAFNIALTDGLKGKNTKPKP